MYRGRYADRDASSIWDMARHKPRGGLPSNMRTISTCHFVVALLNTVVCLLYMLGTVDGFLNGGHLEGLKLSPQAWRAVRDDKHLHGVPVARYVGLTVGFAAVSAAWGIYAAYSNPWTKTAFRVYVGIKVAPPERDQYST